MRSRRRGGAGHGITGTSIDFSSSSRSCSGSRYNGERGGATVEPSGSGIAAIEPTISSGHGSPTPRASHKTPRAATASTMDGPPDLEDADIDRLGDQMCELHGLIAETPANTIAGIACQVRVAITTLRGAATLECGEMALEQVVRALEQRGEFRA